MSFLPLMTHMVIGMAQAIDLSSIDDVLRVAQPDHIAPIVYDSPHSGRAYPDDFYYICDEAEMIAAEDRFVDELIASAPQHHIPVLMADFPRTYIDLNRAAHDIDPQVIDAPWPAPYQVSARAAQGIGLIRRLIRAGVPVYDTPLPVHEVQRRIDAYYAPYHDRLQALLDHAYGHFGAVYHVNWHSMMSEGMGEKKRPDIILGDRNSTSCGKAFTDFIKQCWEDAGYSVGVNDPYKGVEIIRRYGAPRVGRHSIQIEIRKGLYISEATGKKHKGFQDLQRDIDSFSEALVTYVQSHIKKAAANE